MSNQTKKTQDSAYASKWARQIADEPSDEPGPDIGEGEGEQELPVPEYLRRLQPKIVNYPETPPRRLRRRFSFSSLVAASVVGATIVVALPNAPKWISTLGVGTNLVDSTLRRGDNRSPSGPCALGSIYGFFPGRVAIWLG